MIAINQQYSENAAYAGGRIKSVFPAQELWAKPLVVPKDGVAVVLFHHPEYGGVLQLLELRQCKETRFGGPSVSPRNIREVEYLHKSAAIR